MRILRGAKRHFSREKGRFCDGFALLYVSTVPEFLAV
jgi:hypothetical protein